MIRYLTRVLAALAALIISYPGQAFYGAKVYAPDLGDFMGLTQLRHFKLWYAGRSKNLEVANYEIEQIRKSFESVKVFYPTLGDLDMAKMIDRRDPRIEEHVVRTRDVAAQTTPLLELIADGRAAIRRP